MVASSWRNSLPSVEPAKSLVANFLASRRFLPAFVAVLTGFWFLPLLRLDFDPHHDGLVLSQLLGLADGLVIHKDLFSWYGPLTVWSQLPFFWFFGETYLSLRIWTVANFALTAFLIADLGRLRPLSVLVPSWVFPVGALSWIFLSDVFRDSYMLPWSSVLGTTLQVAILYLFVYGQGLSENSSRAPATFWLAGILLGLVPFARINVGLSLWAVAGISLIVGLILGVVKARDTSAALLGTIIGVSGTLLLLSYQGSLSAYVSQSILLPLKWAKSASGPDEWDTVAGLAAILAGLLDREVPLLITVLLLTFAMRFFQSAIFRWLLGAVGALLAIGLQAYLSNSTDLLVTSFLNPSSGVLMTLLPTLASSTESFNYSLVIVFLLVPIALLARLFYRLKISAPGGRKGVSPRVEIYYGGVLFGFGLAGLIQIVPTYDARHLWWGSALVPIAILFCLTIGRARLGAARSVPVITLFAILLVGSLTSSLETQNRTRDLISSVPALEGHQVESGVGEYLEDLDLAIRFASSRGSWIAFVRDGAVRVVGGEFFTPKPYFLNWGQFGTLAPLPSLAGADSVLVDAVTLLKSEEYPTEEALRTQGFSADYCNTHYCVYTRD